MNIPDHVRANFNTLLRAAAAGDLALVECADAMTGEPRYVIGAIGRVISRRAIPTRPMSRRRVPRTQVSLRRPESESTAGTGLSRSGSRERPHGSPCPRSPG
jgi:Family of unknown function (DUF6117)